MSHGVVVDDVPIQFDKNSKHAIIHDGVTIPLDMAGVVSYLESRPPRPEEIDSLQQIVLTSPADWAAFSSTIPGSEPSSKFGVSPIVTTRVPAGPLLPQCHYSTELPELLDGTELSKRVIA
jgi:hypothetical protein